jgi:hypothetical protein
MKQRITYVVKNPDEFSPEQLEVKQSSKGPSFTIKNVDAAKEHRITLGLDELPDEVLSNIEAFRSTKLIVPSSVKSSNNGTNYTSAGPLPALIQQHHPSHHVSLPVYTSSSRP